MRLGIADPPYLGRGERLYGLGANGRQGFGYANGRPGRGRTPSVLRTSEHADAGVWDDPATHVALIAELEDRFDGWALAGAADSLEVLLPAAPGVIVAAWVRPNAVPGGVRIVSAWEPVLVRIPPGRNVRGAGLGVHNVLTANAPAVGHVGAKPRAWTRWVLNMLGYRADEDTVIDMFTGSGAVAAELAQTVLEL